MTPPPPLYDLVLLLDLAAEDGVRGRILEDVRNLVSASGELVGHDEWGTRALTYPIEHRTEAEYHLFQFHGPAALLAELQRTLSITDGIVRFRIIKLKPGTPDAPADMRAGRRPEGEPAPAVAVAPSAEAPPAEAAAPAEAAPAVAPAVSAAPAA